MKKSYLIGLFHGDKNDNNRWVYLKSMDVYSKPYNIIQLFMNSTVGISHGKVTQRVDNKKIKP